MEAFGRFLSIHPEWRGKVTYLQITPKSRSEIQEYADMQRQIDETELGTSTEHMVRRLGRQSAM